jgi:hypothetical protein
MLIGQVELIVEADEHRPEPKGKQRVNLTETSGETERTECKPKEYSACPLCVEPPGEGILKRIAKACMSRQGVNYGSQKTQDNYSPMEREHKLRPGGGIMSLRESSEIL